MSFDCPYDIPANMYNSIKSLEDLDKLSEETHEVLIKIGYNIADVRAQKSHTLSPDNRRASHHRRYQATEDDPYRTLKYGTLPVKTSPIRFPTQNISDPQKHAGRSANFGFSLNNDVLTNTNYPTSAGIHQDHEADFFNSNQTPKDEPSITMRKSISFENQGSIITAEKCIDSNSLSCKTVQGPLLALGAGVIDRIFDKDLRLHYVMPQVTCPLCTSKCLNRLTCVMIFDEMFYKKCAIEPNQWWNRNVLVLFAALKAHQIHREDIVFAEML